MNEHELADLKAELEMPTSEEIAELRERLDLLEFKFNELIDLLYATNVCRNTVLYSKVKTE